MAQEGVGRLARAHLGLEVVGRDVARRRRQLAHLALVRLLLPAVEEVRHVRVLLGLGDVELRAAGVRDDLRDGDRGALRRKGDGERPVLVVGRQRRVVRDRVGQLRGDLAHPVRAEVEGQDGVALVDPRLLVPDRRRADELVGLVARVGVLRRLLGRVGVVLGLAADEQVDGLVGPVPALVAVHREVAPDDRADAAGALLAAGLLDRGERRGARGRRGVAPVGEGVDDEVRHVELGGEPDQRLEVLLGRVHAAAGHEPDQVDALRGAERLAQHVVRRQRAVLHRRVDPREVLGDDRTGAEVEVPDLRVAHLARREADRLALRGQRRVRVLRPERVEHRRVGERDRVPRPVRREPPAVEHDEADGGDRHAAAASTIAVKSAGSRLAPPTRAPSTSSSASSSAALSGLHEPP